LGRSLPELTTEYQHVVRLAQETYKIASAPLQLLVEGWSSAVVDLVSVAWKQSGRLEQALAFASEEP
jgi:hypothetical protein